jgi:hypothetical protein
MDSVSSTSPVGGGGGGGGSKLRSSSSLPSQQITKNRISRNMYHASRATSNLQEQFREMYAKCDGIHT